MVNFAWGIGNSVPDLEGVRRGLLKLFNQDTNTVIETDSAFGITSHSSPERIQEFIQKTGDTSPQQIGDMLVFAKDGGDVVVDEFMEEVRNKVVSTGISESLADLPDYNGLEGIKALDPDREAMFSEGVIRDGKYYGPGSSVVPGVDNQDEIFTIVGKGPNGELLVATSDASPEALASLQEQGVELWSAADTSNTSTTNLTPELTPEQAEQVIKSFDESTGIVNLQGLTPWDLRNLNLGQGGSVWGMLEDLGLTDKQIIEAINSGALQGPDGTSLPTDHLSRFYEELPPGYEVSININKLPEELRSGVLGIAKQLNDGAKQLNDGNGPGGGGGEVLKNALIGTVGGGAVGTITGGAIGGLKKGKEGAIEGAKRGALYGSAAAAGTAMGLGFMGTAMANLVGGSAGGFLGGAAGGVVGGALVEGGKKEEDAEMDRIKSELEDTIEEFENQVENMDLMAGDYDNYHGPDVGKALRDADELIENVRNGYNNRRKQKDTLGVERKIRQIMVLQVTNSFTKLFNEYAKKMSINISPMGTGTYTDEELNQLNNKFKYYTQQRFATINRFFDREDDDISQLPNNATITDLSLGLEQSEINEVRNNFNELNNNLKTLDSNLCTQLQGNPDYQGSIFNF